MEINVPQSIICGDDSARLDVLLYCNDAPVTIICRLIVSKWEIRFQVIIGYAPPNPQLSMSSKDLTYFLLYTSKAFLNS